MDHEKAFRDLGCGMIRDIQLKDRDQWEKLYRGYADFYKKYYKKLHHLRQFRDWY